MKRIFKVLVPFTFAVALVGGAVATTYANRDTMSEPTRMSDEEYAQHQRSIETIGSQYGEFHRTQAQIAIPESEIARDIDHINEKTKAVITEYGVFVKR